MKSHRVLPAGLIFFAAAAILSYKMPERLLDGYLWAEDTRVFLHGAYSRGWSGVFESYAAYMVTLPRIIAIVATKFFSMEGVAHVLPWCCLGITSLACTYVFSVARRALAAAHVSAPEIWAVGIALTPILIPNRGEVFLTITNLQWVLCPTLLVLVWDTFFRKQELDNNWRFAFTILSIVLLTTTGPYGAFIWPLAPLGLMVNRESPINRRRLTILAIYTCTVIVQVITVLAAGRPPKPPLQDLAWIHDFLVHVVAEMFVPIDVLAYLRYSTAVGAFLFCIVLICILSTKWRFMCLVLAGFGVTIWVSAMAWVNLPGVAFTWITGGTRYLYLPAVMLGWILFISAATGSARVRFVTVSLLAMMLLTAAGQFRAEKFPRWTVTATEGGRTLASPPDPSWSVTVQDASVTQ